MTSKAIAALGVTALALAAAGTAGTARAAILAQPCETCGVALGAPLPEGVFFVDLEDYGKRDGQNERLGVNIPIVAWSTPFTFYDTRLEVLYAAPFLHTDGGSGLNRVDVYSQGLLFLFAHSFGGGFSAGILLGPRTADNFANQGRGALLDSRLSLSYVGPIGGVTGIKAVATFHYMGNFGGSDGYNPTAGFTGYRDNIFVDTTLTKTFGKFEFGFVGYAQTDIGGPNFGPGAFGQATVGTPKPGASAAVGGLIGYDFGKVTVQAYATREVYVRNGGYGIGPLPLPNVGGKETRGYVRVIIPLYVAPTAPSAVVAKY